MVEPRDGRVFLTILLLAAVTAGGYFGGVAVAQSKPPKTIEAERFVLRDSSGRARITLEMSRIDPSQPELSFWDEAGRRRASIHVSKDSSAINLFDDTGRRQKVVLGWSSIGAGLSINGQRGSLSLSSYEVGPDELLSLRISTGVSGATVFMGIEQGRPKITLLGPERLLFQAP